MQPLPFENRIVGQPVKWRYTLYTGEVVECTGVIVPLYDGYPNKDLAEAKRLAVNVRPDPGQHPWLTMDEVWPDFMIGGNGTYHSALYAREN